MKIYFNGNFYDDTETPISVFDSCFLYGYGVFETLRTYDGKVFKLEEHILRLYNSAHLIGFEITKTNDEISEIINKVIATNFDGNDLKIKMIVSNGSVPLKSNTKLIQSFCVIAELIKEKNKEVYEKGVSVVTYQIEIPIPEAKTCSRLPYILAKRYADSKKAHEALIINFNNQVKEGSVSNIFIINNKVITTPKDKILKGITRSIILEISKNILNFEERDIKKEEIYRANEVFITSSIQEIVPIVKIDGIIISNGKPGHYTNELIGLFKNYVKK